MYSDDEDMDFDAPEEVNKAASTNGVPANSKLKYDKVYDDFQKWNKGTPVTENVLLTYFAELAEKSKPSTLWVNYSMLKATLRLNDNLDIGSYSKLLDFLKKKNAGYKPIKCPAFTEQEIEKFLNEAPDERFIDAKVVCIFGVNGIYSSSKLVNVMIDHIKQYEDLILVTIPKTETSAKRSFTLTGSFFHIVQKYIALRPASVNITRFFLHYNDNDEKCTTQPIGRNMFYRMHRKMAKYLKLPEPQRYSGLSFRIANTGANTSTWNPACVAEDHNEQRIEHSLDYATGHLKASLVRYSSPSVSATIKKKDFKNVKTNGNRSGYTTRNASANANNNTNYNASDHVCTISCGQVQCAVEENEEGALHAFTVLKPFDYDIMEITSGTFSSDTICRWIVAYTHITEPVSSFNTDETFGDITRSTPHNVRVIQTYIRNRSSQVLAAYIVVYGVNCKCQKQSSVASDVFSFSVNEIKYEN